MFADLQRSGDKFILPLKQPLNLNIALTVSCGAVHKTMEFQQQFQSLRSTILKELTRHTGLFRTAPSLESLESITPPWGFVTTGSGIQLSPYTLWSTTVESVKEPLVIDVFLKAVHISRSCIQPEFTDALKPKTPIIDFDWSPREDEVHEVDDIEASDSHADGVLTLTDPSIKAREREKAREAVRELYRTARAAAAEFYERWGLEEDESELSEESESEDEQS